MSVPPSTDRPSRRSGRLVIALILLAIPLSALIYNSESNGNAPCGQMTRNGWRVKIQARPTFRVIKIAEIDPSAENRERFVKCLEHSGFSVHGQKAIPHSIRATRGPETVTNVDSHGYTSDTVVYYPDSFR